MHLPSSIDQQSIMALFPTPKDLSKQELKEFVGHKDEVNCVSYSSDFQFMVTGSDDQRVRVFNVKTKQCLIKLKGHEGAIKSVAVSPCDKYFASGSFDKTARIWQTANGNCLHLLEGHKKSVEVVTFSPRSIYVCTGSWDRTAIIWSVDNGSLLKTFVGHSNLVQAVAFSFDCKWLATGSWDFTVRVWHLDHASLNRVATTPLPDGVDSGSSNNGLCDGNQTDATSDESFKGTEDAVNDSRCGDVDGTGSSGVDNTAAVTEDIANERIVEQDVFLRSKGDTSKTEVTIPLSDVDEGGSNQCVISDDVNISIHPVNGAVSGEMVEVVSDVTDKNGEHRSSGSQEGHNQRNVARDRCDTYGNGSVDPEYNVKERIKPSVCDKTGTDSCNDTLDKPGANGNDRAVLKEKRKGVSSEKNSAVVQDTKQQDSSLNSTHGCKKGGYKEKNDEEEKETKRLKGGGGGGGKDGDTDGKVRGDQGDEGDVLVLEGHSGNVRAVCFSRIGMLASGSWDKTVRLWNPRNGKCLRLLEGHQGWVQALSFSHDSTFIASAADDDSVKVWDIPSGECINSLEAITDLAQHCAFTSNGLLIASGAAVTKAKKLPPKTTDEGELLNLMNQES